MFYSLLKMDIKMGIKLSNDCCRIAYFSLQILSIFSLYVFQLLLGVNMFIIVISPWWSEPFICCYHYSVAWKVQETTVDCHSCLISLRLALEDSQSPSKKHKIIICLSFTSKSQEVDFTWKNVNKSRTMAIRASGKCSSQGSSPATKRAEMDMRMNSSLSFLLLPQPIPQT